ncbi:hypothetical protein ACLRGF_05565 [Mycetocola zhadangensis]|uniref:hypothetical protein n=1 Tax=Mycetocola zhadangensis TaxID=1164595 RepID=UPI003A4E3AD5
MTSTFTTTFSPLTETGWKADAADDAFREPYVDIDEWRDEPVAHRYVHGGFRDNDTRFSLYLPPVEQFQGRFFQHVTPVPQSENLAQAHFDDENPIPFSIASGAYYVETNGGGPDAANPMSGLDPSIGAYRANAAVARLSRQVAERVFGERKVFGYLYGGSGGGYRTIGASENTTDVWDGFVPYVIGSPMAIPNVFAVRMHAQRVLRDRFPDIVDAYDVGGDPASLNLTGDERAALTEVTRMGFPVRSWFGWKTMGMHAFSVLYPGILAADPTFVDDFWNVSGYLGADRDASIHRDRIKLSTTIAEVLTEDHRLVNEGSGGVDESFKAASGGQTSVVGVRLSQAPTGWALGAELVVQSGAVAGITLRLSNVDGDLVTFELGEDAGSLAVGDMVLLDNSNFLATQTYHRHQVPLHGYPVWDQFRDADGSPIPPQRAMLLGPMFTSHASGTVPTGQISGKMIVVASLLDREAFPWQADWYRSEVNKFIGDSVDERFRLWYTDNALHGDERGVQEHETRTISYVGALQAALRQLSAWVERDVPPAKNTSYNVIDGQVTVSTGDPFRGGVQPVLSLTANGTNSATVQIGEEVLLRVTAEVASGCGAIVQVAADFSGAGALGVPVDLDASPSIDLEQSCVFAEPGTYFVAARVTAQTGPDPADPHGRVHNIARARVTVRP